MRGLSWVIDLQIVSFLSSRCASVSVREPLFGVAAADCMSVCDGICSWHHTCMRALVPAASLCLPESSHRPDR